MILYRFKHHVFKPPYTPHYDAFKGHAFSIDHTLVDPDMGLVKDHVWLNCESDPTIKVKGYVHTYDLSPMGEGKDK